MTFASDLLLSALLLAALIGCVLVLEHSQVHSSLVLVIFFSFPLLVLLFSTVFFRAEEEEVLD